MKCDKCGYNDNGTGDWAHVCSPVAIQRKPVMDKRIRVEVRDWGGDTTTEQVVYIDHMPKSISYDGGRIDIDGHPETLYMWSNSFTIEWEAES